jgi:ribosomal protein S18 acetylase RimI-like enzyme
MTIFNKLFFIAAIGLYMPCITLASEKSHQNSKQYSIEKFSPARDTQPIIDIFNKNHELLSSYSCPSAYKRDLMKCHDNSKCTIKVLQENEKLAGYIMYKKNYRDQGSISQLAVSDDFRNKGYGKVLMSTAMEELDNMNMNSIDLCCYENNAPALQLYNKMGFKKAYNHGDLMCLKYTFPHTQTSVSKKRSTDVFEQPWGF